MRKLFAAFALTVAWAGTAMAYGYGEAEDPMVTLFKKGVAAARSGDWGSARKTAQESLAAHKGHIFEGTALGPKFDAAIARKSVGDTGELFANMVYLSILEKLYRIKQEKLSDFKSDKARLALARKAYLDVLDGNVKKRDAALSGALLGHFDAALEALGNPGLFGVGAKPADAEKFDGAMSAIEQGLGKVFPGFIKG